MKKDFTIKRLDGEVSIVKDVASIVNLLFADAANDNENGIIEIAGNGVVLKDDLYDMTDCCSSCAERGLTNALKLKRRY